MSTVPFTRPPRRPGPEPPGGELLLESPPEVPEQVSGNFAQLLTMLPMAAGGAAMAFLFVGEGASVVTDIAGLLYGFSTVGMMAGQVGRGASDKRRRLDGERRDYLRYLGQARRRTRTAAARQRESLLWNHPAPDALWSLAMSSRLWERRGSDPDFAVARVALGPQRAALRLIPPDTKPVEDLDPVTSMRLRALVRAHATVPELPISVALRAYSRVAVRGDEDAARGLARAALAQLATFHAPDDLRIAICTSAARAADWAWVKWLPHVHHPTLTDGAGPVRLVRDDLADLELLLGADLGDRPRFRPHQGGPQQTGQSQTGQAPHLVVVVDGGRVPPEAQLATGDALGVTVLDLSDALGRDSDRHLLRLRVAADTVDLVRRTETGTDMEQPVGRPDLLTVEQAEALARTLSPRRMGVEVLADRPAVGNDLPTLLGLGDLDEFDAPAFWNHRAPRDRLRIALGVSPDGVPVELDVKEAAQGGMGPHGLIVGATGSGKSELLRTLVMGMAMTHSSETLNFVLTDFKGGATFLGLDALPHTSAVITNLAEELPLVDRMQDAIRGELVRRQELLRAAGNYTSVYDYERARAAGAPLAPLPTLLVVVDEFSELLANKPEFAELFVMIGRVGRSLAVHLLLASQRLEEGRLRGLETHLSYRICLRTFSAIESRLVLGVPDAYELPNEPGSAYLKYDVTGMNRFRAAYISGPYRPPALARSEGVLHDEVLPFTAEPVRTMAPTAAEPDGASASLHDGSDAASVSARRSEFDGPSVSLRHGEPDRSSGQPVSDGASTPARRTMDVMLDRLRGQGPPAHRVWLPPLDTSATLDALLGPLLLDANEGLTAASWSGRGTLRAPIGEVDRPFEQRRDPLVADLSGAAGNVAVVGAPQSGKSNLLRSLVASLALTHSPRTVQFYCLDFGGGALASLSGLPHVGSAATRLQPDVVRRTIAELTSLLKDREASFALHGIDSMAAYRRMLADGMAPLDAYGDVFLVVDGWATLRAEFEQLERTVTDLAARGLGYGIHVVVAANRWTELRPQLRESLATRYELRIGDPFESDVNRHLAANVPENAPGRGIGKDRLHFRAALPRIDGAPDPDSLADGVRHLVESVAAAWPGPSAPPVRLLPAELPVADLLRAAPSGAEAEGIPFGVSEDDLAPVYADLREHPHLLVLGSTGSGKTNLLRVLLDGIVRRHPPTEARIIIIDFRRTLLEAVTTPHLIDYAAGREKAATTIAEVAAALRARLPGPDVTATQLRERSWWTGADLYLVLDDYELVGTGQPSPIQPLLDLIPHARDIGLHLLVARNSGGAARAVFEPLMQRLKELAVPGVLLSSNTEDGALLGDVKGRAMPPGRGLYVQRGRDTQLIQTAWLAGD